MSSFALPERDRLAIVLTTKTGDHVGWLDKIEHGGLTWWRWRTDDPTALPIKAWTPLSEVLGLDLFSPEPPDDI